MSSNASLNKTSLVGLTNLPDSKLTAHELEQPRRPQEHAESFRCNSDRKTGALIFAYLLHSIWLVHLFCL